MAGQMGASHTDPDRAALTQIDRLIKMGTYPGTGSGECNGAQTASVTDATTQQMIQTVYNCLRQAGLLA